MEVEVEAVEEHLTDAEIGEVYSSVIFLNLNPENARWMVDPYYSYNSQI